jgi:flagellar FliL protein
MADATTEPTPTDTQAEPPKKKSRKLLIIILLCLILLGGGGGGAYYFFKIRPAKAAAAKELAEKKEQSGGQEAKKQGAGGGEGDVNQVIELQPFIVNLADKNESRYLRMTISLGVAEAGEAKVDPVFTTKVRNAILAVISARTSDEILTVEGKAALRKEMLGAARGAADKPEVLTIYITDFIIQM